MSMLIRISANVSGVLSQFVHKNAWLVIASN